MSFAFLIGGNPYEISMPDLSTESFEKLAFRLYKADDALYPLLYDRTGGHRALAGELQQQQESVRDLTNPTLPELENGPLGPSGRIPDGTIALDWLNGFAGKLFDVECTFARKPSPPAWLAKKIPDDPAEAAAWVRGKESMLIAAARQVRPTGDRLHDHRYYDAVTAVTLPAWLPSDLTTRAQALSDRFLLTATLGVSADPTRSVSEVDHLLTRAQRLDALATMSAGAFIRSRADLGPELQQLNPGR